MLTALAGSVVWAGTARAQAPVGQWRFDEGSGAIAHDTSGSGLDGTLTQGAHGVSPSWVDGVSGSALEFDHHDAVALPISPALESPQVTVAAWVRRDGSPGRYRYIFSKGATGCYMSSYALYTGERGSVAFYVSSGGHYTLSAEPSPSTVWDGRWHRLVGTYDGRDVRLYVDGRQVSGGIAESGGINYGLASSRAYIGAYRGGCVLPFSGDIDTVEIYDAALNDAAVAADAGLPAGVVPPPLPGSGGGSLPFPSPSPSPAPAPAPAAPAAGGGQTVKAGCLSLRAQPGSLRAGRTARIVATARVNGRLRAHVRLSLRGRDLMRRTAQTDRHGRARLRVRIPSAERHLTLSARASKALACTRTVTLSIPVHR